MEKNKLERKLIDLFEVLFNNLFEKFYNKKVFFDNKDIINNVNNINNKNTNINTNINTYKSNTKKNEFIKNNIIQFTENYLKIFDEVSFLYKKYKMPENIISHSICVSVLTIYIIFLFKIDKQKSLYLIKNYFKQIYNIKLKNIKLKNSDIKGINNKNFNIEQESFDFFTQIQSLYSRKQFFIKSAIFRKDFFYDLGFFNPDIRNINTNKDNILFNNDLFKKDIYLFNVFLYRMIKAALLHDIGKIFEIKYKKDKEKIVKWIKNNLNSKDYFNNIKDFIINDFIIKGKNYLNHAILGYYILKKEGLFFEAQCTRFHLIDDFINNPHALAILIINLADKMVMHSRCVSLKERFDDLEKRYPEFKDKFNKNNFKIYETFFKILNIDNIKIKDYFNSINNLFNLN